MIQDLRSEFHTVFTEVYFYIICKEKLLSDNMRFTMRISDWFIKQFSISLEGSIHTQGIWVQIVY